MKIKDWPEEMTMKKIITGIADDEGNVKTIATSYYVLATVSRIYADSYKLSHIAGEEVEFSSQVGMNYCMPIKGPVKVGSSVWAKIAYINEYK